MPSSTFVRVGCALALASVAGVARADAPTPGPIGSLALGTGTYAVNGELAAGWRFAPWLAVLARVSGQASERDGAADYGVAVRLWYPDADRFYAEPQLGRLSISPEFDCIAPTNCIGGHADGFDGGLTVGAELARNAHASFDARVGISVLDYVDHGSHQHQDDTVARVDLALSVY